jgi:hypothetical protein
MPCGIRTHDPSVWASEDSSCLRPRDHCDCLKIHIVFWIMVLCCSLVGGYLTFRRNVLPPSSRLLSTCQTTRGVVKRRAPCSQETSTEPVLRRLLQPCTLTPVSSRSSHLHVDLPSGAFSLGFVTTLYSVYISPCTLNVPFISSSLIWSP